jgi:NADH-quinone oxidoreductase subunit M
MWPVHTWLPDAHVEAPTGGSVILAAITLKIGGYGFLRFIMPIVPDACAFYGWVVVLLSLLAITYIGFVALVQEDLKKLIAYSSISHMGFVTLGLFLSFSLCATTRNIGEAAIGIEGAMIQMVSHGFISGALFFCVGIIYTQMKTRLIKDYGGVINKMPLYSTFLMFFVMSNSGLPGTSGFIGEFFVILCAFKVSFLYAFLASTSLILGAAYNLWMYKRVVFGNIKNSAVLLLRDIDYTDRAVLGLLAFFVLILGIWPQPLLTVMHSSTEVLLNQIVYSKV